MDKNIESFSKMQNELIRKYHGKTVVFYKGKLVAIDKDIRKAEKKAEKKTKGKEFFVHELYTPEELSSAILIAIM